MTQVISPQEAKRVQETLLEMKKQASEDPIYFIDTFVYIFNIKQTPSNIRFKLFPFQKRLIRELVYSIRNGEDIFVDKTREMGVSYTVLALFLWFWLFEPGSNFLVGSRKEDYVDNRKGGTTGNKEESLFGKLDYMLSRLPKYLLPDKFNPDKHFNFMSLVNPENGNAISGESSNENFSRGGRQKAILLDEFAFWDNGTAAWGSTADTTNCRIVVTTPGIKPSKAKRLRFGKDGEKIKIVTVLYTEDPRKNGKWLEEQRSRRSEEDFNREIMINWETSITGRVYPEILTGALLGKFPFLVNQQLYCSWDFGLDGTAFGFWQQNPNNGKWRRVESYQNKDQPIQWYFPFFGKPIDSKFEYSDTDREAIRQISTLPRAIHFGDPDVKKTGYTSNTSAKKELAKIGVHVQGVKMDWIVRREKTKVFLQNGVEIHETERNEYFLESIKMSRYPQREESSQATTPVVKPVHDWSSHHRSELEYFVINIEIYQGAIQTEPDWAHKSSDNGGGNWLRSRFGGRR